MALESELVRWSRNQNQEDVMAETKMALMTRLRAEGRWDEADRFREETRERVDDG